MINYVNLTPQVINIYVRGPGLKSIELIKSIDPDGNIARVNIHNEYQYTTTDGVPYFKNFYGHVTGLPNPVKGTVFIVSTQVRLAVEERIDVASPGELIQDINGQPIGCYGLIVN